MRQRPFAKTREELNLAAQENLQMLALLSPSVHDSVRAYNEQAARDLFLA